MLKSTTLIPDSRPGPLFIAMSRNHSSSLPLRTGLFVPAEHPQGAEGVPAAWPTLALVGLDRHVARVSDVERPAAVAVALGRDQVDRLGHPLVGVDAGAAQVLEAPQHV